jgi:hypothetical protein
MSLDTILSVGQRFVLSFSSSSLGEIIMALRHRERERLCGHRWWKLNIIACGYGGSNAVFGSYGVGVWENVRRG